jgi:hypothetical protein
MVMLELKRIIQSKPDSLGRVTYTETWYDPNFPYCSVCGGPYPGATPPRPCPHIGTHAYGERGQVFFTVPPKDGARVIRQIEEVILW